MTSFRWNALVILTKTRLYILGTVFLLCYYWPYTSVAEIFMWPALLGTVFIATWTHGGNGAWLTASMFRPTGVDIHLLKRIARPIEYRQTVDCIVAWSVSAESSGFCSIGLVTPNSVIGSSFRIEHLVKRIQKNLMRPARIVHVDSSASLTAPLYIIFHGKTDPGWAAATSIKAKLTFIRSLRNRGVIIYFNETVELH